MRLRGTWRRGSTAWRVGLYSAFLAMGLFVGFDLLDVDGSRLYAGLSREAVTTVPSLVDRESLPAKGPLRLEPIRLDAFWQTLSLPTNFSKICIGLKPAPIAPRFERVRLRSHARHMAFSTRLAAEDPA